MVTPLPEDVVMLIKNILKCAEDIHRAPPFYNEETKYLVEDARSKGNQKQGWTTRTKRKSLNEKKRHKQNLRQSSTRHLPVGVGDMVHLSEEPLRLGCFAGRRNIGLS